MAKLLFIPVSIGGSFVAAMIAKKGFELAWGMIDDQEPPEPATRETSWPKLLAALAIEGAVFRVTKGAVDHVSRRGFLNATGVWPGEQRPDPA